MAWAIKWRSENRLDGKREHLMGHYSAREKVPACMAGHTTMVFETRRQTRAFIREFYGYLQQRPDLRAEPHGWRAPIAVKVEVTVREI